MNEWMDVKRNKILGYALFVWIICPLHIHFPKKEGMELEGEWPLQHIFLCVIRLKGICVLRTKMYAYFCTFYLIGKRMMEWEEGRIKEVSLLIKGKRTCWMNWRIAHIFRRGKMRGVPRILIRAIKMRRRLINICQDSLKLSKINIFVRITPKWLILDYK